METADSEDPLSLGAGEPGCTDVPICDDGLAPPCGPEVEPPTEHEGSAEVHIEWPELEATQFIP